MMSAVVSFYTTGWITWFLSLIEEGDIPEPMIVLD